MRSIPTRLAALALVALALPALGRDDDGFRPLVRGTDPSQFELVGIGPDAVQIVEGEVRLTGQPNGYFATKDSYRNYTVRFDWMYERPEGYKDGDRFDGNSGLLVHITGGHKVWPKCTEVQLANSDAGRTFAINGAKFRSDFDDAQGKDARRAAQKKAIKPVGEWNAEEVTCKDGAITCRINGVEIDRGTGADPDSGSIGWQSEGKPVRFRDLKIKKLD